MAGLTDAPFRFLVGKNSSVLLYSEMMSARALLLGSKDALRMLEGRNLIAQIAVSDVNTAKETALLLNNYELAGLDLNCGCPVNKVLKQGCGSALLEDLPRLIAIVEALQTYSKHAVSVKIRLGLFKNNVEQIVQALAKMSLARLAIHARTQKQGYSGKADYLAIKRAKELAPSTPLLANGDIDASNAQEVLRLTGANGLMIGRAALGKPWIFDEIKSGKSMDKALRKALIKEHFALHMKHYKAHGLLLFRKHLHEYSKGLENAASFRTAVNCCKDEGLLQKLLEEFF